MANLLTPELVQALTALAGTLLTAATGYVVKKVSSWIDAKTGHEASAARTYLTTSLETAMFGAVAIVEKGLVAKAKGAGAWTDAAKAEAKAQAVVLAKQMLGPAGVQQVAKAHGIDLAGLDSFIATYVEKALVTK